MAIKFFDIPGVGKVRFQKRRGSKSIKIHIHGSDVRVTLPFWVPYSQAISYTKSKTSWILKHKTEKNEFVDGSLVGKKHQLTIKRSNNTKVTSKITPSLIMVNIPNSKNVKDIEVQNKIQAICEKILKSECEELITPFVNDLSVQHGFKYYSLRFKKLRSRWGSCDQNSNIVLNTYLIQLPWEQIEYVIVHELAHTREHNHSKDFWDIVNNCVPKYKEIKKRLKQNQPEMLVS